MKYQKKYALHLHSLYDYWFCYENWKKELSTSLFRRMKIQNEKDKDAIFIEAELESEPELESETSKQS